MKEKFDVAQYVQECVDNRILYIENYMLFVKTNYPDVTYQLLCKLFVTDNTVLFKLFRHVNSGVCVGHTHRRLEFAEDLIDFFNNYLLENQLVLDKDHTGPILMYKHNSSVRTALSHEQLLRTICQCGSMK